MVSELLHLASIFLIVANSQDIETVKSSCFNNGNYTSNSTYGVNLGTLLSSLSTNVDDDGFYNATMGQRPDIAYASVLCRGDLQLHACRSCIQNATTDILRSCPNYKQAVQMNGFCSLRYSSASMFGIMDDASSAWYWSNFNNSTSPHQFMADVRGLLDRLCTQAANGGSLRKVAAANISTVNFQTIFSLVQCTPDLSKEDCSRCFIILKRDIPKFCSDKIGCVALHPSCTLRYEVYTFYNETRLEEKQELAPALLHPAPSSSQPSGPRSSLSAQQAGKKNDSKTRTIIIIVSTVAVVGVCASILWIKRRKTKPKEENLESEQHINPAECLRYDFWAIKSATDDFSDANKLGQGGFGAVYKGKLPDGQEIAAKRLSVDSGQGDVEFKNEVLLVAKLQHRNLVRLLGFSMEGKERLLIYEFVQNTSLDKFIFDPIVRHHFDWERRNKIIRGIARGLLYLHEESRLKIIHRDLKASNILLDGDMNPKIADFGMARLCATEETHGNTSRIVGTYGYMSPEYAMHGQFSIKSDVFSFGVLILEIVSGQKNHSFRDGENTEDLLTAAWKYWRDGNIEDILDPVLRASLGSLRDVLRCIHIGLLCVQDSPTDRPTMASVVVMLSTSTLSLPVPLEPISFTASFQNSKGAFYQELESKEFESTKSSSQDKLPRSTESSNNVDLSITELYGR